MNINFKQKLQDIIDCVIWYGNKVVVTPEKRLIEDFGFDSLDMVELVMSLEEAFNIEVLDKEALKWKTVDDIDKYLEEKLK